MILTYTENYCFADFAGYRVGQGIFKECFAEDFICLVGEEFSFKIFVRVNGLFFLSVCIGNYYRIALVG